MADRFDVVVLGAGPAGEVAVNTLLKAGKRIALIEREVIGGECSNWGCIPSKTLLRPPELKGETARAAGVATPALDFSQDFGGVRRGGFHAITVALSPAPRQLSQAKRAREHTAHDVRACLAGLDLRIQRV